MPKIRKRYLQLWKVCLQYGECTSFDIVGIKHMLLSENTRQGVQQSGKMWSEMLSEGLSRLVTHLVWPTNYPGALSTHVAAAIKYAVILHTNDQRRWVLWDMGPDPFFDTMREASGLERGAPEIHIEVRRYLAGR